MTTKYGNIIIVWVCKTHTIIFCLELKYMCFDVDIFAINISENGCSECAKGFVRGLTSLFRVLRNICNRYFNNGIFIKNRRNRND